MLAAGLDAMNSAVGWGIAMLANNLDMQEKAVKAIREIYPEDQSLCDVGDDQSCRYLVILVKEILRYDEQSG
jgi:cytochrome P450